MPFMDIKHNTMDQGMLIEVDLRQIELVFCWIVCIQHLPSEFYVVEMILIHFIRFYGNSCVLISSSLRIDCGSLCRELLRNLGRKKILMYYFSRL